MLTADVVKGFSSSLLQKSFDAAVQSPECHYDWWKLFCSDAPNVAIAAPRGHAKTTALTHTFTLASVLFRQREYVLVVSDTITQACGFVGDIKKELLENDQLRSLFKVKELIKDTEDDLICMCEDGHTFRISAKGAEQKLRGLKWNNKRPDLIICDDLENDEIVMNRDRRMKFKRWFYGALLPCRSRFGVVRYVGTILHNDSLLESLMPKRIEKYTEEDELRVWSTRPNRAWVAVKYRAHNPDFSKLLWEDRYDKQFFLLKRAEYVEQGLPDVYSQEYLNVPLDESMAYFRRSDLRDLTDEDRTLLQQPDSKRRLNFYISTDLAVSEKDVADWSVFIVGAMDEKGYLWILDIIRERMDSQEIVETILNLEKRYEPIAITMEKGQIEKAIGPFLRQRMLETGIFPAITTVAPSVDKLTRARSIQARMRAGGVKFDKSGDWYYDFEDEATLFPRGKHDDQVDAMAYMGLIIDRTIAAPTRSQLAREDYEEEYELSGLADEGRSSYTGY